MRILWLSDRIIGGHSAYSKVTYEVCTRLAKMGHAVAHIPMGMSNRMGRWVYKGVMIYPSGRDPWGEDVVVKHYIDFKADMLITLKEPWVFNNIYKWAINFVPHAIIDHSPVSPAVTSRLHTAFKVIAITRFGQRELRKANIPSIYIPHGVDCSIYKPLNKAKCRKMWFLDEDEFVVGVIAMNRARKMIPQMLRGYKRFLENNPDIKSHLMLWTNINPTSLEEEARPIGVADVGVSLLPEILELGLGEAVRWTDEELYLQGIPEWAGDDYSAGWDMVKLYNSFDVLLHCTGGEGFGLPLIEAQSCGVPVITTDYAGAPEQVGAGLTIRANDYVVIATPGTRFALADIDQMADALTKIMNADPEKLAKKARKFAERYDWSIIMEKYWKPFLEDAEIDLKPLVTQDGVRSWA